MRLLGFFAVFMIVEFFVIVQVGYAIGGLLTVGLLLLGMVLGAFLISHSGLSPNKPLRPEAFFTSSGNPITMLLRCFAGLLFIIPGFISDVLALLVLLPFSRGILLLLAGKFLKQGSPLHQVYTFSYQAGQGAKRDNDPLKEAFFQQSEETNAFHTQSQSAHTDNATQSQTEIIIEGEFRDVTDDDTPHSNKIQ